MPKKLPHVSLRKPPAAVDPHRADDFVHRADLLDAQTSESLSAQTSDDPVSTPSAKGKAGRKSPKSLVARSDGRTLRRMTLYLPNDLARRLAIHCAREDQEMSAVVSEAVRRHLARVADE